MGEHQRTRPEEMATTSTAVATVSPQTQEESVERVAVITLRPGTGTSTGTDKQARKKVVWTEDTVDNEHMNKKKSKCCCIYEKPRRFDESDSESSDEECEHCYGHVEKRHTHTHSRERQREHEPAQLTINEVETDAVPAEATATMTLQPSSPSPAPAAPPDEAPTS